MSVSVYVRFAAVKLPAPQAWQAAIRAGGLDLELDCDFDPKTFTGFLPVTYRGSRAGFEYFSEFHDDDALVSLSWGGNFREAASGFVAAACLCKLTEGKLEDPEAGETISASEVVDWAKRAELELQEATQRAQVEPSPLRPWWKFW